MRRLGPYWFEFLADDVQVLPVILLLACTFARSKLFLNCHLCEFFPLFGKRLDSFIVLAEAPLDGVLDTHVLILVLFLLDLRSE